MGKGSTPCDSFAKPVGTTAQYAEVNHQVMLSWAQGYLSFYNSVSEGTYDVTLGGGPAGLENWLSEFCGKNPQASLVNAVDELLRITPEKPLILKPMTH